MSTARADNLIATKEPGLDPLLQRVQRDFIGLGTRYKMANGRCERRVYLDSAATTLMLGSAAEVGREFLAHYANAHSVIHFSARAATECYAWARERVLSFTGADPERYTCIFVGSGSTGAINRAVHYLSTFRPQPDTVLVSLMEHHSNDLPHRHLGSVRHVPLAGKRPALGAIDVDAFARLLGTERVRYAAVSTASNVTGIVNPIGDMVALAHAQGVPVVVDASQSIAHVPTRMAELGDPDMLVFSGHKVYAPGSPGVLIIRRDILEAVEPVEFGGGMVDRVTKDIFEVVTEVPERDEAGTPNIVGAVLLAAALEVLDRIGMDRVATHERALTAYMIEQLSRISGLRIYGSFDLACDIRTGLATFNISGLDHGFVAAILNDYHNVAVRNECFCAHPYVRELLLHELWALEIPEDPVAAERQVNRRRGMVRASLGLYSTHADIDALTAGLRDIQANAGRYEAKYRHADDGNYYHTAFSLAPVFDVSAALDRQLSQLGARSLSSGRPIGSSG